MILSITSSMLQIHDCLVKGPVATTDDEQSYTVLGPLPCLWPKQCLCFGVWFHQSHL